MFFHFYSLNVFLMFSELFEFIEHFYIFRCLRIFFHFSIKKIFKKKVQTFWFVFSTFFNLFLLSFFQHFSFWVGIFLKLFHSHFFMFIKFFTCLPFFCFPAFLSKNFFLIFMFFFFPFFFGFSEPFFTHFSQALLVLENFFFKNTFFSQNFFEDSYTVEGRSVIWKMCGTSLLVKVFLAGVTCFWHSTWLQQTIWSSFLCVLRRGSMGSSADRAVALTTLSQ